MNYFVLRLGEGVGGALWREECIRTLFDYYKGGQVYGSGINRTRPLALHGDACASFELIIIESTSNSQNTCLVDCVRC